MQDDMWKIRETVISLVRRLFIFIIYTILDINLDEIK